MDSIEVDLEQKARRVLRGSVLVTCTVLLCALVAWKVIGFVYWREVTVGATLMTITLVFYSELGLVLLLQGRALGPLLFVASLKIALLCAVVLPALLLDGPAYSDGSAAWFVAGFLTLLPTSFLLAKV